MQKESYSAAAAYFGKLLWGKQEGCCLTSALGEERTEGPFHSARGFTSANAISGLSGLPRPARNGEGRSAPRRRGVTDPGPRPQQGGLRSHWEPAGRLRPRIPWVCVRGVRTWDRPPVPLGLGAGAIREGTKALGLTCALKLGCGLGGLGEASGPGAKALRVQGRVGRALPARWWWRRDGGGWGRRDPPCGPPALTCGTGEGAAARGVSSRPRVLAAAGAGLGVRGALLAPPFPLLPPPAQLTHAGELGFAPGVVQRNKTSFEKVTPPAQLPVTLCPGRTWPQAALYPRAAPPLRGSLSRGPSGTQVNATFPPSPGPSRHTEPLAWVVWSCSHHCKEPHGHRRLWVPCSARGTTGVQKKGPK